MTASRDTSSLSPAPPKPVHSSLHNILLVDPIMGAARPITHTQSLPEHPGHRTRQHASQFLPMEGPKVHLEERFSDLSPEDTVLFRSTFKSCMESRGVLDMFPATAFSNLYYENLYKQCPEAKLLFNTEGEYAMFTAMMRALVRHNEAETPEDRMRLDKQMRALGKKHTQLGVTAEMYLKAGKALLAAVSQRLQYSDDFEPKKNGKGPWSGQQASADRAASVQGRIGIGLGSFNSQSFSSFNSQSFSLLLAAGRRDREAKRAGTASDKVLAARLASDSKTEEENPFNSQTGHALASHIVEDSRLFGPEKTGISDSGIAVSLADGSVEAPRKGSIRAPQPRNRSQSLQNPGVRKDMSFEELPVKCRRILGLAGEEPLFIDCHGVIAPIHRLPEGAVVIRQEVKSATLTEEEGDGDHNPPPPTTQRHEGRRQHASLQAVWLVVYITTVHAMLGASPQSALALLTGSKRGALSLHGGRLTSTQAFRLWLFQNIAPELIGVRNEDCRDQNRRALAGVRGLSADHHHGPATLLKSPTLAKIHAAIPLPKARPTGGKEFGGLEPRQVASRSPIPGVLPQISSERVTEFFGIRRQLSKTGSRGSRLTPDSRKRDRMGRDIVPGRFRSESCHVLPVHVSEGKEEGEVESRSHEIVAAGKEKEGGRTYPLSPHRIERKSSEPVAHMSTNSCSIDSSDWCATVRSSNEIAPIRPDMPNMEGDGGEEDRVTRAELQTIIASFMKYGLPVGDMMDSGMLEMHFDNLLSRSEISGEPSASSTSPGDRFRRLVSLKSMARALKNRALAKK